MIYKKIRKILDDNLTALDYLVLLNIANGMESDFLEDPDFTETFTRLDKKGYIALNKKLTLQGKEFLENLGKEAQPASTDYYENLHKKLQERLFELTKKRQFMIQGRYAFLCNATDLKLRLQKVIKKYNLTDLNRIEKVLLLYVTTCHKNKFEMVSTLPYYILKNVNGMDVSKLATDYEIFEDIQEVVPQDTTTNI